MLYYNSFHVVKRACAHSWVSRGIQLQHIPSKLDVGPPPYDAGPASPQHCVRDSRLLVTLIQTVQYHN